MHSKQSSIWTAYWCTQFHPLNVDKGLHCWCLGNTDVYKEYSGPARYVENYFHLICVQEGDMEHVTLVVYFDNPKKTVLVLGLVVAFYLERSLLARFHDTPVNLLSEASASGSGSSV